MTSDEQLIEAIRASLNEEVSELYPPADLLLRLQAAPASRRLLGRRLLSNPGGVVAVLVSAAVVAVVVVAFASVGHRRSGAGGTSTVPASTPAGARALVARMAVLRRPQTAADRLPESVTAQFPGALGVDWRIIPSLTRLAATIDAGSGPLSSVAIYVVVETPCSRETQGICHGPGVPVDIVTTLAVGGPSGHRYLLGQPEVVDGQTAVATGGLTPTAVGSAGDVRVVVRKTSIKTLPTGQRGVNVSVVPDGVTRVKWVFGVASPRALRAMCGCTKRASTPLTTVHPQIKNNIAVAKATSSAGLSTATWYGPDGQVIASLSPIAQQDAEQARALAASERDPIAPALTEHFAIFRHPVPPPATITQPPKRIAVAAIGNYGYDQDNGYRLNVAQARFVPYPGTTGFWVIPGSRGVEIANGNYGGGANPLSGPGSALSGGMIGTSFGPHGETVHGLAPDGNPTVTVVLAGGATRTVRVIDNVYSITLHPQALRVIIKDAAGHRITIKAPR
jgi:hypothetical protein